MNEVPIVSEDTCTYRQTFEGLRQSTSATPTIADIRTKGQVWTPRWVADIMAAYLAPKLSGVVLDPAVGPGSLLAACRDLHQDPLDATAFELDRDVLAESHTLDTFAVADISRLHLQSFLEVTRDDILQPADAIIANPPYLRHHRISAAEKEVAQETVAQILGHNLDRRAGLHIYFLVKALGQLAPGGRLSFILPADTFQGVFSRSLWTSVAEKYSIEGILSFCNSSPAFPGVDTDAAIVFISNHPAKTDTYWMRWAGSDSTTLCNYVTRLYSDGADAAGVPPAGLAAVPIDARAAADRGLLRDPRLPEAQGASLGDLAHIVRGIATGANDYFLMTSNQVAASGIAANHFVRAVARVRDVDGDSVSLDDLDELDRRGRPTYLLYLDRKTKVDVALSAYLQRGVELGVSSGALVRTRNPWYAMEKRQPPPILFTYLGRRNSRFIETTCSVLPLTGYLCVYPREGVPAKQLLAALNHPATIEQLAEVGKSYGSGAIKVEPGGLRRLIVPNQALDYAGLQRYVRCV